jgi:hypothetical protein
MDFFVVCLQMNKGAQGAAANAAMADPKLKAPVLSRMG